MWRRPSGADGEAEADGPDALAATAVAAGVFRLRRAGLRRGAKVGDWRSDLSR